MGVNASRDPAYLRLKPIPPPFITSLVALLYIILWTPEITNVIYTISISLYTISIDFHFQDFTGERDATAIFNQGVHFICIMYVYLILTPSQQVPVMLWGEECAIGSKCLLTKRHEAAYVWFVHRTSRVVYFTAISSLSL